MCSIHTFLILVFSVVSSNVTGATSNVKGDTGSVADYEEQQCISNIKTCKLSSDYHEIRGKPGPKGAKGEPGELHTGPRGPKGSPGLNGTCGTREKEDNEYDDNTENIFGTEEYPAKVLCSSAPRGTVSGTYYMGPSDEIFEAYCNMTNKATCIIGKITSKPKFYKYNKNKPFWLSLNNINIQEIYSLSTAQIEWLQQRSLSAYQVLRYYCKNSVPYSMTNVSQSINLLTWNDLVIGPVDNGVPMKYIVPNVTDGSSMKSKAGHEEVYTDIIVNSKTASRLPIIDMQIKDTRGELQEFGVANVALCYK